MLVGAIFKTVLFPYTNMETSPCIYCVIICSLLPVVLLVVVARKFEGLKHDQTEHFGNHSEKDFTLSL